MTDSVVWLDEVAPDTAVGIAGAKMGRLTELRHAGVTVPAGFTVTVDAYQRHCAESGLGERVNHILADVRDASDAQRVQEASDEIRRDFVETPMPDQLAKQITSSYEDLCLRCLEVNVPTAVRSSATGEDSADASFAGIFDTYLGLSGPQRVLDGVKQCWGSLFTPRALAYRLRRGMSHLDMPIAVGVIELVHARASGVAFSVHPVTGKADRVVVEANWGWGEAVVQGLVTPDHVEVGKSDNRVLRYDVSSKQVVSTFDYASGRVVETDMPGSLVDRQVLDEEQVGAIVEAVTAIERHYGHAVDVEWVLDRHRRTGEPICIVQARPVTGAAAQSAQVTPSHAAQPAEPAGWNPAAMASKYVFGGKG